jgi:hypothetical protein
MWTTLALMTLTMAPAQTGTPELKNARFTYGLLGQTRKSDKFLPGDAVYLRFDIDNMTVKKDGRVLYAMQMEITKKGADKPVFKRAAEDREVVNLLGGSRFPSVAIWPIQPDAEAPGEYTMKLTVTDKTTGKSAPLTQKFTVVQPKLGFVQVFLTTFRGDPVPPVGVPGQKIMLYYRLTGFEFDKKEKQSNLTVSIRILDADGKQTLAEPYKGDIKSDAKTAPGVLEMHPFMIDLNRAGKFKIEMKVTDNVAAGRKSETLSLDLTVVDDK